MARSALHPPRRLVHALLAALLLGGLAPLQGAAQPASAGESAAPDRSAGALSGEGNDRWFGLERLNTGLPPLDPPPDLRTPQSALEHLVLNVRSGDTARAGRALNLNLVPEAEQERRAGELAERLVYLLETRSLPEWDALPNRPDGLSASSGGQNDPLAGEPRRALTLGTFELNDRDVAIQIRRVRVGEGEPLWVLSAGTVEAIDPLWNELGPGPVDRWVPGWARARPFFGVSLWEWGALVVLVVLGILAGRLVTWLVKRTPRDDLPGPTGFVRSLAQPLGFLTAALVLFFVVSVELPLTGSLLGAMRPLVWLLLIAALTWLGMRAIGQASKRLEDRHLARFDENDGRAMRHRTVLSVVRRLFVLGVLLLGLGIALSQYELFAGLGATLLSSAGVISVVLGIAAQPVLGNLAAGVQLAVTQPLRIGDSVFVHDNWGRVEELGYTYAVIRTWDERRLMVPMRHLVTESFENWSIGDSHLIKPIHLYADPTVDVQALREHFAELLENDEEYDGEKEPTVQVTEVTEEAIVVRALCSAADPSTAWSLHCRLREQMIAYLRDLEGGRYLVRQRVTQVEGTTPAAAAAAPAASDDAAD